MCVRRARLFVDISLIFTFIVVAFSGLVLHFAPYGPRSRYWSFIGVEKFGWIKLHTVFGLVFAVLVVVHLWLNRKMLVGLMKRR